MRRCARELRRAPCTRAGHHAYLGGLLEHTVAVATLAQELCHLHPRLNCDLLLTRGARARPRPDARVHLRRRDRADRRGAAARASRDRLADAARARAGVLDEHAARWRCCTACSATTAPTRRPGGRFGRSRRSRCTASTRSTPASRARSSTGSASREPRDQRPIRIGPGAARAWWPIQSSKLAGPGSPRLGRFDSFAASWLEMEGFGLLLWAGKATSSRGSLFKDRRGIEFPPPCGRPARPLPPLNR